LIRLDLSFAACRVGLIAASCLVVAPTSVSHAHLAKSSSSLRSLIAESDLVIRARLIERDTFVAVEGPKEKRRSILSVQVLEVLKGSGVVGKELPVSQHGHGVATYRSGEEALFFLRQLSQSRELHKLAATGELQWYSWQEHDDDYVLSPKSRHVTLEAARRYEAIEQMHGDERVKALRRVTVKLLASRDLRLATSALRDLVQASDAPLVTKEDVPALTKVIDDPQTSIGIRVGLLAELQRRGLLEGDPHWLRLLRATNGTDRLAVIHAAGVHPSLAVNAELIEILMGSDSAASAAAAIALGSPGNAAAVAPLSSAIASDDTRVAMSAIRGLGRIKIAEARVVLASAAQSHPDASVRRRAQAELRVLEAHQGWSR
jgi:hypothetical protein